MFLNDPHTVAHLHDFWYSPLIDRRRYSQWLAAGSQTMYDRLGARVKHLLSSHQPEPLADPIKDRIHSLIAARETRAAVKQPRG